MRARSRMLEYSPSRHRIDLHPYVAFPAMLLVAVIWAAVGGEPLTIGEYGLRLLASMLFLGAGLAVLWFGASRLSALLVTILAVLVGWWLSPVELAGLASFGAVAVLSATYFQHPTKGNAVLLGVFVGLLAAGMGYKAQAVLVLFALLLIGRLLWHLSVERITKKRLVLFFIKLVFALSGAIAVWLVAAAPISFPFATAAFTLPTAVWPAVLIIAGLISLRGLFGTGLLKTARSPKWRGIRLFLLAFGVTMAALIVLLDRFGSEVFTGQVLEWFYELGLASYNLELLMPALFGLLLAFSAGVDRSLYKNAWLARRLQTSRHRQPSPIRIAFDASPLLVNKTGIAYYIERLTEQIAKQYAKEVELIGFYYNFLGRKSTKHFPSAPNLRYRPIRFIPSKVVYQLRRWGFSLPVEVLIKEPVDFVLFGNFWGYPSLENTAAAPIIHDLTYLDVPESVSPKNRKDLTRLVPEQIKRSRFVVTVSASSKQGIMEAYGVDSGDILVTHIPPPPLTHHSAAEQQRTLKRLGINKPFMLMISTVGRRKNIVNLIDAYQQLPKATRSGYALILVGRLEWDSQDEVARIAKAKADGLDVMHLGYVDEDTKAVLFETATLFVHTSNYEGFGMPVLEAMHYGTPCALSDITIFREIAGQAALYFDQTDPKDISRTIATLLESKAKLKSFGRLSKQQALAYSWPQVAEQVVERIKRSLAA